MINKNESSLFNFIQEHAAIGTWEYDIKLATLQWSSETKKIHDVSPDYKPDVDSGLSFYKAGQDRDTITQLFTDCINKHANFDTELQIVTATGHDKWVRSIGMPIIENNKCIKVQGLFQDIDEKTKITKTLALKEQHLRKTFESALVGMAIIDLKGNWIDINQSLCNTFGYTKEEFKKYSLKELTHPEDIKIGYKSMIDMINGNLEDFEAEKRYIGKNGQTISAIIYTSIIRDDDGKPLHIVAQINDRTQIKKSNSEVVQLLETTEYQNKRLLNFAQIVSHNLRSHYSNLDMLLDILKIDRPESTKNEIFPLIKEAVTHLGETLENLNEVATINLKKDLKTESLNLLDHFNKALSSISALIIESKTTLIVDIDKTLSVKAIPAYLDSILLNFLTNAIRYKKQNEPAKIEIKTETEDNFVILIIKDYGQGIDLKKHSKKLFGMYKTFHKHEESRGLGLFITKNQVEAIGGKIKVESTVNEYTTFYTYLKKHE
ncbi:PAS domain S-box protein [uncultured Formosa sp.]|uniref:PAS domain-containing sensor histidine kinase n=1 Tax=uncultured Formosa sp. TaxID=255435 RepID=UPI00262B34C5|nr:PAS domain S-box protein [uncultured Formosa sp.]